MATSNPLASVHYADNMVQLCSLDCRTVSIIGSVRAWRRRDV